MCARCLRPVSTCICAAIQTVAHSVQVLILMHPDEVGHAKNTGRLLHLSLPQSRVEVGLAFDENPLNAWLHEAWGDPHSTPAPASTLLLYPATPGHPAPLSPTLRGLTRLVVIDATWRQSRQMIAANPALARLPLLALSDVPPSRYAIRRAHETHQLSTLEATHLALRELEPGNASIDTLDDVMKAFIALQRPFWPHAR